MEIEGAVVLVTGASMGIGQATARRFAQAGAKLALVARSVERLEALADTLRAEGTDTLVIPADLCDATQVKQAIDRAIQHFGRIDVLINNAGQAAAGTVAEVNLVDVQQIMALNVYAPLLAMQGVIPQMRLHGGGLIINVSSMVSRMHIPGLAAYTATKTALNAISDTARVELAPDNIRVITILPRLTATDFGANSLGNQSQRRQQRAIDPNLPVDTPDHVAERIYSAALLEPEEQLMAP